MSYLILGYGLIILFVYVIPLWKLRKKSRAASSDPPQPPKPLKIDRMLFTAILIMCNLVPPDYELVRANSALLLLAIYGAIQISFLKNQIFSMNFMTMGYYIAICTTFLVCYILLLDKFFNLNVELVEKICNTTFFITMMVVLLVWLAFFVSDAIPELIGLCK